jgi:hypothetical protein
VPRRAFTSNERDLDWFLERLEGIEANGTGYKAWCPCHADEGSALKGLSLTPDGDGPPKVFCHSEHCVAHSGSARSKVEEALEPKGGDAAHPSDAEYRASYTYRGSDGREYVKYRKGRGQGKKFYWDPAAPKDVALLPYRPEALPKAIEDGRRVLVVESEESVHAAEDADEVATTSGTPWTKEHAEHLRDADVLIVRDRDESGRAQARKVRRTLIGVARSARVYDPLTGDDSSHDDLEDHLASGYTIDELVPADRFQPHDLGRVMRDGLPEVEFLTRTKYADYVHALTGEGGIGKTLFELGQATSLIKRGVHVGWIDQENGEAIIVERLLGYGVGPEDVSTYFHYYPFQDPTVDDAEELLEELLSREIKHVWCDTGPDLYAISNLNENDNMDMTRWVQAFTEQFRRAGIGSTVIEHLAQSSDGSKPRGGTAKKNKLDVVYNMIVVSGEVTATSTGVVELERKKDRRGRLPERVRYEFGGRDGSIVCDEVSVPLDEADQEALKTGLMRRDAIAALLRHGPMTASALEKYVPGEAKVVRQVIKYLPHGDPIIRLRPGSRKNSHVYFHKDNPGEEG